MLVCTDIEYTIYSCVRYIYVGIYAMSRILSVGIFGSYSNLVCRHLVLD